MKFINEYLKRKKYKKLGFNKGIFELKFHSCFNGFDVEKFTK